MKHLSIIPAGAGSGKTHRIQEILVELIKDEKNPLPPERIVAVTYTEAAAAELRGRIRAALVSAGLLDQALRLDHAYISTIHGFGLRLLTEFSFDGGLSPAPRMLSDDEQSMLVSRSLTRSDSAALLMQRLMKYGYTPDITNNKSAEQVFRETVLKFIATLRSIGRDARAESLSAGIERQICNLYGEALLAEHLKGQLLDAVKALLRQFPAGIAGVSDVTDNVREGLRKEFIALKRAEKGAPLDSDWALWKKLANLKTYKNPAKNFPAGYQELAEAVIAAAEGLARHPGPLADALEHAALLLGAATDCLDAYSADKRERSLLDFTDMVALSRRLLCLNDDVIDCLRGRVECLVIDEFQDTNPLQFSLLWALTRKGVPTVIVGDLKQAIMGFQGADPRLLQALCDQYPDNTDPLPGNWRTTATLMAVINQFGTGLFGSGYSTLKPMAGFTSKLPSPLELVVAEKSLKNEVWASHLVGRLHRLINDPDQQVYDKRLSDYRRLKGGDIAILCPTSKARMKAYATALRAAGLRSRMPQAGWFQSRSVQLACHALAYVANPGDVHAGLYLAVTELGGLTLQDALKTLIAGGEICQPELHGRLEGLAADVAALQVDEALGEILRVLDLYGRIATWEDAPQARADLLRLQEECSEFRNANREALACSGYYGSGIKTFLAWLKDRAERDDRKPEASVLDEDAVQLVTWHSSKGREWPVVAVCGLDDDFTPRLPATRVEYEDFDDLGAILEKVRVEILPGFDSGETQQKFLDSLLADADRSAARLLYVALTRAREKLILEWPIHQAATRDTRKNKSYWDLFTEKTGARIDGGKLVCGELAQDFYRIASDTDPWVVDLPAPSTKLALTGRRALRPQSLPTGLTPETITPSSLHGKAREAAGGNRVDVTYGEPLTLAIPGVEDAMEKGKILHRAFEVLSDHPERRGLLPDALGQALPVGVALSPEQGDAIFAAVAAFDAWLKDSLSPQSRQAEVPLLALNEAGSVVHGFADMIVETADGLWIVDHKSDFVPTPEQMSERFDTYFPQVRCYADALGRARPDKPVRGVVLNWVSFGRVSLEEF